jgi:hypothetical protein
VKIKTPVLSTYFFIFAKVHFSIRKTNDFLILFEFNNYSPAFVAAKFLILNFHFRLGEPLRSLRLLASGYPLHHLLARFAVSQVVPLLSLSQENISLYQL